MDVETIIEELRAERQQIERAILSLERFNRGMAGPTTARQFVTAIRARDRKVVHATRRADGPDGRNVQLASGGRT